MQDVQKIRFLAANFSVLQGLKSVPLGLLLIVTTLWANAQTGPASDLSLPILSALLALLLYVLIQRYYAAQYGQVERTPQQKWVETLFSVLGALLGLGAFLLDTAFHLPFSCLGLLFTLGVLAEYGRANLFVRGRYLLLPSLAAFLILLVASLLPVLGFDRWWLALGLRAQIYGIVVTAGGVMVLWGLAFHLFLVRQFTAGRS